MDTSQYTTSNYIKLFQEQNEINSNLKKLLNNQPSDILNTHMISPSDDGYNYTPLQFGAKHGLVLLTHYLLRQDDVQLGPFEKVDSNKNCKTDPLFLAAENGQHDILKLFKYHNFSSEKCPWTKNEWEKNKNKEMELEDKSGKVLQKFKNFVTYRSHRRSANFNVLDENRNTILHIVLQQPLLKDQVRNKNNIENSSDVFCEDNKIVGNKMFQSQKSNCDHYRYYASLYRECINVLLDLDRFDGISADNSYYTMEIRSIINYKNSMGNTPLHYAVSNWSEAIVKKLLSHGANAGVRNKDDEMPLSRISKSTFESFLNKSCISVDGFDPSDDEVEEAGDSSDEKEKELEIMAQDYNQTFMMKISQAGNEPTNNMKFDFAFLSPPQTLKRHKGKKPSRPESNGTSVKDIETGEQELIKERHYVYEPEMDLLMEMGLSENHRSLITHPVISSFLWIKWKLMSSFFNRSLRLDFLFCYCVIWHIFIHFGGKRWNSIRWDFRDEISNQNQSKFCKQPEYTLQLQDFASHSSYAMFGYYLFIVYFMFQLGLIIWDLYKDVMLKASSTQSPIIGFWADFINVCLCILVIIGGQNVLWLVITLILVMCLMTEIVQMTRNLTTFEIGYFKSIGNLLDLGIIVLVAIVLYLPTDFIINSREFSIFDKECKGQECKSNGEDECKVLRCISGIVIVFIVVRYLMSIAKLPRFKGCNLYVLMYYKVMKRYVKIMIWYSFFIIAFGLGFYIMLHNDTEDKIEKDSSKNATTNGTMKMHKDYDPKHNKFRNPYHALIKCSIMFIGEIEYGDLPIHGGDVSVAMSYFFLLMFIFLMVIVLVNLLNGLAVSDIIEIKEDSLIENQVSLIDTIRLFELLYIGQNKKIDFTDDPYSCNKSFFMRFIYRFIVPKGIFLFNSSYLENKNKILTFPLERKTPSLFRKLKKKKESDCRYISDSVSKDFLNDAREILIQERKRRIEARKLKTIEKWTKEMRRGIKKLVSVNSPNELATSSKEKLI